MRVSHSRIKTWRRCEKQFEYKYVEGLRRKKKNKNLAMGSWMHDLLMVYMDGEDWVAAHRKRVDEYMTYFEEEREDLGDLPNECSRLMKSYIRTYGKADKRDYRVIDTEMDEIITLPNGLEVNVIIDIVLEARRGGGLWAKDYKTRTKFDAKDLILLDPQYTTYYDALEIMGYNKLKGFIVDEIRKKAPTVPRVLKSGHLSQAKNIDTDVWTYMAAIRTAGHSPDRYSTILQHLAANQKERFFRRTYIPKDPPTIRRTRRELIQSARQMEKAMSNPRRVYTRAVDNSCLFMCDYRDLCVVDLHGGDTSMMKKMGFEVKNDEE
jgi:hypothetical protein